MEELQDIDQALPAESPPDLPEALQAPTRQIGYGFMILLTASAMSLYILYAGIGSLLLPFQSIVSTLLGGYLSDRLKRLKIFAVIGMIIMAVALLLLALFQVWLTVVIAAAVLGFGLGAYLGVGTAILTLVLPSAKDRAKDMGIFNIANTLPHSMAPVMAGFILGLTSGNYTFLFVAATIFVLLGIFTVFPIKAIR